MQYPTITAAYAAIFAFLFAGLSGYVVVVRGQTGIVHGDGGHDLLNRCIRAHSNFAEYVPYVLLIVLLIEAGGAADLTIHMLLAPLLVARLMHPIGMRQRVGSIAQYAWRATSTTVTWLVMLVGAGLLLGQIFA